MTCDRYWREGIVLVERGLADLHREGCSACQRAHAARNEIVAALPFVGPPTGDATWQARVWQQIAREEQRGHAPRSWVLGGAIAAACVVVVLLFALKPWSGSQGDAAYVTTVMVEKGPIAMRGDAQIGDIVRTLVSPTDEVRIYRGSELVFRCSRLLAKPACTQDARGSVASYTLEAAGEYKVIVISFARALEPVKSVKPIRAPTEPRGSFDRDLAAIVEANVTYRVERELSVR